MTRKIVSIVLMLCVLASCGTSQETVTLPEQTAEEINTFDQSAWIHFSAMFTNYMEVQNYIANVDLEDDDVWAVTSELHNYLSEQLEYFSDPRFRFDFVEADFMEAHLKLLEGFNLNVQLMLKSFIGFIETGDATKIDSAAIFKLECDDSVTLICQSRSRILQKTGLSHEEAWTRVMEEYGWITEEEIED